MVVVVVKTGCGGGGGGAGIQGGADGTARDGVAGNSIDDFQIHFIAKADYYTSTTCCGDGLRLYTYRGGGFYLHHHHFILD